MRRLTKQLKAGYLCLKLTPNTDREFCWDFHLSKARYENMIHFARKKINGWKSCLNVINISCRSSPYREPSASEITIISETAALQYNIIHKAVGRGGQHEFWEQRGRGEEAYRWAGSPQRCQRGPGGRQTFCRPRAPFPAPRAPEHPVPVAQWSIHLRPCESCPPVMEENEEEKKKNKVKTD